MSKGFDFKLKKMVDEFDVGEKSAHYQFGFKKFGPFLYCYTQWLINQISFYKLSQIYFFSRDGYLMEKAFKILCNNCDCESNYVYFSRNSLRQALLWRCSSLEESLKYFSAQRYVSYAYLLEYFGFDEGEREEVSRKYNINLMDEIEFKDLNENIAVNNLYNSLKSQIYSKSKEQDSYLRQYLNQIKLNSDSAIVDIGWYGSMQFYLEEYFRVNNIDVKLYGFYIGINPRYKLDGVYDGFIFNPLNLKLRKKILCFFGLQERLFQSLEGSTKKYKVVDNNIKVMLAPYEYEENYEIRLYIQDLQQGALDFCKFYEDDIEFCTDAFIRSFIQAGCNPTSSDVELFYDFYNVDGNKYYYLPQKNIYRYSVKEFLHNLSNSPWKTGFLKRAFKVPFPYFWIYEILKK